MESQQWRLTMLRRSDFSVWETTTGTLTLWNGSSTELKEFEFVIHVGDITNAWFDGVDEGREQLDAVTPRISRDSTAENFYIWGIETEQSVQNSHSGLRPPGTCSSPKMTQLPLLERRSHKIPS